MEIVVLLFVLCLLMFLAYRGVSTIIFAPICAIILIIAAFRPILPNISELFMIRTVSYIKSFFPIFLMGSLFGQVMGDSGFARSIAKAVIKYFGKERAALSVALTASILTYGGVSLLVVTFAVYPLAAAIYREANIPKRLMIGALVTGAFTATLGAFPGSAQISNIIPASFFGTNIFVSPGIGIISGSLLWICCYLYIYREQKKAAARGEGYGANQINEPIGAGQDLPTANVAVAVAPLFLVLAINYYLGRVLDWDTTLLDAMKGMKLPMVTASVKNAASSWASLVALTAGTLLVIATGWKYFTQGILKSVNTGANGAILAIMNTAVLAGFGGIMASTEGFKNIIQALMSAQIGSSPLWSLAIAANVMAGITGSASASLQIVLDAVGKEYIVLAAQTGTSLDIMTRVAAMASGGFSLTPHNGALITMFVVCGLSHKTSYYDVAIISLFKGAASFVAIILYLMFGNF